LDAVDNIIVVQGWATAVLGVLIGVTLLPIPDLVDIVRPHTRKGCL
jgi:hypothetical protein